MIVPRIAAAIGLVLGIAGFMLRPDDFPHAWLSALVLAMAWPLGSIALLLAHALTGGRWGEAIRPGLMRGVSVLFMLPFLVLPVLIALPDLYPWARPDGVTLPNHAWLNLPLFAVRGCIYLVVWLAIGILVLRTTRLARVAPFALVALAITTTFASIDLVMSLEPRFVSTIYGMLFMAGSGLLALAMGIVLSPGPGAAERDDLGQLMLALAMLWAYLDFMQLLIVWQSDLAEQTPYYHLRAIGIWGWVNGAVALCHSAIPFFALMSRGVRRSRYGLRMVAVLLIVSEVVRTWWLVLPAAGRGVGLLDLGCVLAVGALLSGIALRRPAELQHA